MKFKKRKVDHAPFSDEQWEEIIEHAQRNDRFRAKKFDCVGDAVQYCNENKVRLIQILMATTIPYIVLIFENEEVDS